MWSVSSCFVPKGGRTETFFFRHLLLRDKPAFQGKIGRILICQNILQNLQEFLQYTYNSNGDWTLTKSLSKVSSLQVDREGH